MNIEIESSKKQAASTQYYTIDQANMMIPDLDLAFIRIKQMQTQIQDLLKVVKKSGVDFVPNDEKQLLLLQNTLDEESIDTLSSLKLLLANMQEEISTISKKGCTITSIDQGVVHWPYKHSNNEVIFLSWLHGETVVNHWCQNKDDKSSKRRPLSDLSS